jgi:hypothetical protein
MTTLTIHLEKALPPIETAKGHKERLRKFLFSYEESYNLNAAGLVPPEKVLDILAQWLLETEYTDWDYNDAMTNAKAAQSLYQQYNLTRWLYCDGESTLG